MSGRQFARWREYYSLEPFGSVRDDLRAAAIVVKLHNTWSTGPRIGPGDVFETLRSGDEQAMHPEEIRLAMRAHAALQEPREKRPSATEG